MKENNIELSLVIACYNEEEIIEETLPRLKNFLDLTNIKYELIIIDDKSKDRTVDLVNKIIKDHKNTKFVVHKNNTGRGGVIKEGINLASGKYVGFIDIDLEVPEHYIFPAIILLRKKNDVVIARRFYKIKPSALLRWFTGTGYVALMRNIIKLKFTDTEAGFKFFNREKILPVLKLTENNHWFWDTEIVAMSYFNKLKIAELPVVFIRREDKTSTVKLFSDTYKYFISLMKFRKRLKKLGYI
ncbi:glycosyltransferase family 2 protein [Candidatus Woesearchaeota archaeon]|nr:glycosyltransferase family 2 protein [Candidatus Woesearchaeota archaeon]